MFDYSQEHLVHTSVVTMHVSQQNDMNIQSVLHQEQSLYNQMLSLEHLKVVVEEVDEVVEVDMLHQELLELQLEHYWKQGHRKIETNVQ